MKTTHVKRYTTKKTVLILLIMILLILILTIISIFSGKMNLSPTEVIHVFLGKGTDKQNLIVYDFRLPRIKLALYT